MRAGTWNGRETTDNVRVTVNGVVRPVKEGGVTVKSGMRDGHPRAESGQWCVTATIEWADPDDVTAGSPEPFTDDSWLPKVGDTVLIETGDGALGQWWVKHRGVIDYTTGSLADGTATSATVDRIDELGGPVSMWAALAKSAPPIEGEPYRYVGMSNVFLIDRMLRHTHDISGTWQTGWYATPPRTWQTVGSAPCQGSLIPEVGYVREAINKSAASGPRWEIVPYGVAPANFTARYDLSAPASTPVLSMGIPAPGSGVGNVAVTDDAGRGLRIQYMGASGNVGVSIVGTTPVQSWSVPLGSNRRVAAYLQRTGAGTQTVQLRMQDGTLTTYAGTTDLPAGWAATRVVVDTDPPLGWWVVENDKPSNQRWATIDHVPTARLRVSNSIHLPMDASRDIYLDDAAQWVQEQVDAECSQAWLDEDGVFQYATRGYLESGIPQTVTTDLDVQDVQWEVRGRDLARNLSLKYSVPSVSMGYQGAASRTLWEGSATSLGPGEEDVTLVNVPEDQDWFSVDTTPHHVNSWGQPSTYYSVGSTFGGSQYTAANSDGAAWAMFLNCTMTDLNARSYEVKFGPWSTMTSTARVNSKMPQPSDALVRVGMVGSSALVLRGRATNTWREAESLTQISANGRGTYAHDVGWRVQGIDFGKTLYYLKEWLTDVLASPEPTITGLVVEHDPRRQIGDKIRVQDKARTGQQFDVLCQQVTFDSGSFTDTITGRMTSTSAISGLSLPTPAGHTALTPASNWNREVAS